MNAVQLFRPSTSSARPLSWTDKLVDDLFSIVDDEDWSDIEVKVQGKSFPCHKNILAARSSYFKEKLRRDRRLTDIVEEDGNSDAFELVRQYIYAGTAAHDETDEDLIANVLCLSVKYKLDELTTFISDQMMDRITTENAVKVFTIMTDRKVTSVAEKCMELIKAETDECLKTECYTDLTISHLALLLNNANLSDTNQLTVIRKWSKGHPDMNAAKLFKMLDGEIDCQEETQKAKKTKKKYILIMGYMGNIVILDADTLEEVSIRNEPATQICQIAVCNEMFYVINTKRGEIKSTPVSSLLKSQPIEWKKCVNFQSSLPLFGKTAVVDAIIYFMDRTHLWKFDTISRAVARLHAFGVNCDFYSMIELNGLIYAWIRDRFQFTDGISEWKPIHLPPYFGQCPDSGSLIKMHDSVCLVGGCLNNVPVSSVFCYNTSSKTWTMGNSINQARQRTCAVSLDGGRSIIISGYNGQWLDTVELFDQQANEWRRIDYKCNLSWPQAVTFYV